MSDNIEYKEGNHSEFISYLFSNNPKPKGSICLELPLIDNQNKNLGLHIFEQLLMIFADGMKYFYGENDKVDINNLTEENIKHIQKYFLSINYSLKVEIFPTINEYKFKFPNYFKNQKNIQPETKLEDFYYEIFNDQNCVYRLSFDSI